MFLVLFSILSSYLSDLIIANARRKTIEITKIFYFVSRPV
nr:MAG TPA: hypothetical protein [Caudoviricetes sp.]